MAQRRALIEGAALANQLGDIYAAQWYTYQAGNLSVVLDSHWSESKGNIINGYGTRGEILRDTGLDIADILAVIQTDRGDGLSFSVTDDRVLATLKPLVDSFKSTFSVNKISADASGQPLGVAIGRYFGDNYDGINTVSNGGNPWYLATAAIAEYLYKVSIAWKTKGFIPVTRRSLGFFKDFLGVSQVVSGAVYSKGDEIYDQIHSRLMTLGDSYIRRVMYHSKDGRLPEQYNKETGEARGSKDLTWSYAAIVTAAAARDKLVKLTV
jgi:glucoamylase